MNLGRVSLVLLLEPQGHRVLCKLRDSSFTSPYPHDSQYSQPHLKSWPDVRLPPGAQLLELVESFKFLDEWAYGDGYVIIIIKRHIFDLSNSLEK